MKMLETILIPTTTLGVQDVKSGAQGITLDGTPYNEL